MNNYQTFENLSELPIERIVTVVTPSEEDTDAILIGDYHNGRYLQEPSYLGPVEVTDHVGNYLSSDREVYVHEDAEHAYNIAQEYSKIYTKCGGDFECIANALDERFECLCMEVTEDCLDDEFDCFVED